MTIFTTLGMFIVDENRYIDSNNNPLPHQLFHRPYNKQTLLVGLEHML